jgi:hypothetical protein
MSHTVATERNRVAGTASFRPVERICFGMANLVTATPVLALTEPETSHRGPRFHFVASSSEPPVRVPQSGAERLDRGTCGRPVTRRPIFPS